MKKILLFTTALFLGFAVLSAQPGTMSKKVPGQKGEFSQRTCFQSNLTEEQVAQMKELRLEHTKKSLKIKNDLGVLTAEYKGLMTGENQDLSAINKKIDQMQELKTELFKMNAKHRLDVRNLMTDEQKIQFDSRPSMGQRNANFGNCPMQANRKPGAGRGPNCRR